VTEHNGPIEPEGNSSGPGPPARRVRRFAPDDDLLAGFDRVGRPKGLRAFFASTIAVSLLVWDLTFTLGAYHTVFYSWLFQILVASTVLLLGALVLRRDVRVRPWMLGVLAIPLLWLISRGVAPFGRGSDANHVVDLILIALTLASVPFTLIALARVLSPDYFELPARRLKAAAVAIIVLIGVTGFLVGQFNYEFTTCHEYDVAGNDEPSNCRMSPTPSPRSTPTPTRSASPGPSTTR
jgi:hypothetical protein